MYNIFKVVAFVYCKFCGTNILNDSINCPNCGNSANIDLTKNETTSMFDGNNYNKKTPQISYDNLESFSLKMSFISLIVFLFFNIKMAPSYGIKKLFFYIITAFVTICLVFAIGAFLIKMKKQVLHYLNIFLSFLLIASCVSLRIMYESKIDLVKEQIPTTGEVLIQYTEKTDYYNSYGEGSIQNPSTKIKIGDKWHYAMDKFLITLNNSYTFRVETGGGSKKGYFDGIITFEKSLFTQGKYIVPMRVKLNNSPLGDFAEMYLTFERCCTFWEVIFH